MSERRAMTRRRSGRFVRLLAGAAVAVGLMLAIPPASAAPVADSGVAAAVARPLAAAPASVVAPAAPQGPHGPHGPHGARAGNGQVTVNLNDLTKKPSTPILVLLGLTLLSLAPAI